MTPSIPQMADFRWPCRLSLDETKAEVERIIAASGLPRGEALDKIALESGVSRRTANRWAAGTIRGPGKLKSL
jgi:hypothetical protein